MILVLATLALSSGGLYERIRTWTGGELDHLGIGISSLGDVNGDGYADFIVGKMTGAYTFCFGPGAARVISGKDGSLLYEVRGTDKEGDCGDAFGDTITALGDLDRDGAPDLAVGAWRYQNYLGLVAVYSGRTGKPLATIYGNGRVTQGAGPEPPKDCESPGWGGFGGSIANVGALDGDSVPDFAIGDAQPQGRSVLVSGAHFKLQGSFPGVVVGATGDFDGDGHSDVMTLTGECSAGITLAICSGVSHRQLAAFPLKGRFRFEKVLGSAIVPVGDLDGDGFLDVFTAEADVGDVPHDPKPVVPIQARWISGRTGKVLHELELDPGAYTQDVHSSPIGDVDGDGRTEVLLQASPGEIGSKQWLLSGNGTLLGTGTSSSTTEGRRVVRIGDLKSDDSIRLLVSDYESQAGAKCGGAVHLVRLTLPPK